MHADTEAMEARVHSCTREASDEVERLTMVNVIGLGYIGLPTALIMASHGIDVVGTDYNESVVGKLESGTLTFEEDGLDQLYREARSAGIAFTTEYEQADVYIVSVPTPYDPASKKIDPSYVVSATESVLERCSDGAIVVIESTVSPGTIDRFIRPLVEDYEAEGGKVHLVHAPERIIPGKMVYELTHNNRTIGADDPEIGEKVAQIYGAFCRGDIVVTDIKTAEMSKVVENTFRDVNIAFANELAKICALAGLDVHEVIRIANKHPRVSILNPGPGVGGHCISVDPWFLVGDYPETTTLIRAAREENDSMPSYVLKRASEIMGERGICDSSKVGIYGLTYKEDVDDIRESPTLQMLDSMKQHLASGACKIYDPWVKEDVVVGQVHSLDEFLEGLEMVILMVGHSEIREGHHRLDGKIVLDTRDILPARDGVYKL